MGDPPRAACLKALNRLRRIFSTVARLRPSYVLTLRIATAYGTATLSPLLDSLIIPLPLLQPVQKAVYACTTVALRIPRSAPHALLKAPLLSGGFGTPDLASRNELQFLLTIYKAATNRNALVSRTVCHLIRNPTMLGPPPHDASCFLSLCAKWKLVLRMPPHSELSAVLPMIVHSRRYQGGPVLLVSDGSAPSRLLGWGALVEWLQPSFTISSCLALCLSQKCWQNTTLNISG